MADTVESLQSDLATVRQAFIDHKTATQDKLDALGGDGISVAQYEADMKKLDDVMNENASLASQLSETRSQLALVSKQLLDHDEQNKALNAANAELVDRLTALTEANKNLLAKFDAEKETV